MMLKQVSWRRSNRALFLFSLLLVPTYLFSGDPDASGCATKAAEQAADATAKAEAAARSKAGAGAGVGGEPAPPRRGISEADFFPCSEKEIAIQERILRTQGEEVNSLHKTLARQNRVNRVVLFHGEPGVGKSDGAIGLCRRMNLRLMRIDRHQISSGSYGTSGKKLVKRLNSAVAESDCCGIFIDECDKIFDHPEQQNRDTAQTANDFWVWTDDFNKLPSNKRIVILAANDITHFPQPLLSRLSGMIYEFHGPTSPKDKADALASYFPMYPDLPLAYIQKAQWLFTKYPKLTGRDFQLIYQKALDYAGDDDVTMDHAQRAIEKIHQERLDSKYYDEDETPQDQAERHFNWNSRFQLANSALNAGWTIFKIGKAIHKWHQGDTDGASQDAQDVAGAAVDALRGEQ